MPVARPSKEYAVLCHVHHVKMGLHPILLNNDSEEGQILAYACTEPDCPVRYNILCGYFLLSPEGGTDELQMVPRVRCPQDGVSMYLVGINPEKRSFRLWECPQCGRNRSNEESLVG